MEFRENLGLVVQQPINFDIQQPIKNVETFHGTSLQTSNMDYRKLRDYLAQGKWKKADDETTRVMLAVAKREKEGWLNEGNIDNFPCEDLRTIDQLWVKYSGGKFGFSVQKRIYQSFGGTRQYNREIWEKFGNKVGWRGKNSPDITFLNEAPEGHLPGSRSGWVRWWWFFSRVQTCKL